jgi:hypothetical protein
MSIRLVGIENHRVKRRATLPRPFRAQKSGKSNLTRTLIRQGKDQYIRQLYARLGPEDFYRRRLAWLSANGKWTSYNRLVVHLSKHGLMPVSANNANTEKPSGENA